MSGLPRCEVPGCGRPIRVREDGRHLTTCSVECWHAMIGIRHRRTAELRREERERQGLPPYRYTKSVRRSRLRPAAPPPEVDITPERIKRQLAQIDPKELRLLAPDRRDLYKELTR